MNASKFYLSASLLQIYQLQHRIKVPKTPMMYTIHRQKSN